MSRVVTFFVEIIGDIFKTLPVKVNKMIFVAILSGFEWQNLVKRTRSWLFFHFMCERSFCIQMPTSFYAKKCYIMSINCKSTHYYTLWNHILQQFEEIPHLWLTLTESLKWSSHITKITKKATTTLNFLRRNLKNFPHECRKTAYISLVCSILNYGHIVWDPYLKET